MGVSQSCHPLSIDTRLKHSKIACKIDFFLGSHSSIYPSQDPSQTTMDAITKAQKIRAVTYQDAFSVDHSAYKDLELGFQHHLVGCNSKIMGAPTNPGDLILIMAVKDGIRYFTIGILENRAFECTLWKDHGGHKWDYNFHFRPLTGIVPVCSELTAFVAESAECHHLTASNFFNMRFCSGKLRAIFQDLFAWDKFQKHLLK